MKITSEHSRDHLVFFQSPTVQFAGNSFRNVPTILQYDRTPLVEVVDQQAAGYTTRISIYHNDGTHLAKVVGSRLFLTDEGAKASLKLRHPDQMTVATMGNSVLFEMRRNGPAALSGWAELFTPDGAFLRCKTFPIEGFDVSGDAFHFRGGVLTQSRFEDLDVGIHVLSNGSLTIGGLCNIDLANNRIDVGGSTYHIPEVHGQDV